MVSIEKVSTFVHAILYFKVKYTNMSKVDVTFKCNISYFKVQKHFLGQTEHEKERIDFSILSLKILILQGFSD